MDLAGNEVDEPAVENAEEDDVTLAPFETDNPWLHRLFEHSASGRAPEAAESLLYEVSAESDELLLFAIRVRHGMLRAGYLVLTTHWIRWVQTLPVKSNDFWPLTSRLQMSGMLGGGGVIHVGTGHQFQGLWLHCRRFIEIAQLAMQASLWEGTNDAERSPNPADSSGLADEMTKLAELHRAGLLTAEEFTAAKAKLLS